MSDYLKILLSNRPELTEEPSRVIEPIAEPIADSRAKSRAKRQLKKEGLYND